jgi:hypothetical protein
MELACGVSSYMLPTTAADFHNWSGLRLTALLNAPPRPNFTSFRKFCSDSQPIRQGERLLDRSPNRTSDMMVIVAPS